jgi:hypothetical protein
MASHGLDTSLLVFAISLLIGGFAISVGAKLALKSKDYSHAVLTALLGAIAWGIVDVVFGEIGIEGALASIVGLLVWVWVVRLRYEVGWFRASVIGFGAWIAALITLSLLSLLGVSALDAYGVPGV